MLIKTVIDNVLALPPAERQEVAERIWESLRNDLDADCLTEAQKALLDQRLLEMEQNPDDDMSLEEVGAKLRELK